MNRAARRDTRPILVGHGPHRPAQRHRHPSDAGDAPRDVAQQVQRGATVLMRAKVQVVLVGRSGRPLRVGPMMEKVFG